MIDDSFIDTNISLTKLLMTPPFDTNISWSNHYWHQHLIDHKPIDQTPITTSIELTKLLLATQFTWSNSYWQHNWIDLTSIDNTIELIKLLLTKFVYSSNRTGVFRFQSVSWFVSLSARDLISKLLVVDPRQRLTAGDVLEHEYITNQNVQEGSDTPP